MPSGAHNLSPVDGKIPCTRLPMESAKAYEAFRVYCELGGTRSQAKTASKLGKNTTTIAQWSSRWQWIERIRAWDDEQREIQRQADAIAALEYAKENQKRQREVMEKTWMIQEKMTEKFLQMMAFPVVKVESKPDANGVTKIYMPGPWRFGDAIKMGQVINQLGAFASGLTKKLTDPDSGKTVGGEDEDGLPLPSGELPRLEIVVVHQHAQPEGGDDKSGGPVKPMKESGGFHFARS